MNLYIQISDNSNAVNHPVLEENLLHALPEIDINNLPQGWARFVRVAQPTTQEMPVGNFEKLVCTYELMEDGSTYTDIWSVQPMTDVERQQVIRDKNMENHSYKSSQQTYAQSIIQQLSDTVSDEAGIKVEWINYAISLGSVDLNGDPFNVAWPTIPTLPAQISSSIN